MLQYSKLIKFEVTAHYGWFFSVATVQFSIFFFQNCLTCGIHPGLAFKMQSSLSKTKGNC